MSAADQPATGVQKQVLLQLMETIEAQLDEVVTPALAQRMQKIYLTGCGDSYFASVAVRNFYDRYVGIPTEPVEAMEFSRYVAPFRAADALVVGVSNSGRVSRTVEAIVQGRRQGATTLAATAYADRPLAQEADAAIVAGLPNVRATLAALEDAVSEGKIEQASLDWSEPGAAQSLARQLGLEDLDLLMLGLGAYYASALILYLLGLRLACLRQHISEEEAQGLRAALWRFPDIAADTANHHLSTTQALAELFQEQDTFLIIGAGPSYGTSLLTAAKLFEQPHLNGVPQQLEEWAHQQFFFTRSGTPLFVVAPPGASRDRAIEQIEGARDVGATVVVICDREDSALAGLAHHALPIYGALPEPLTPLTYVVPGQLFAFAMLQVKGQPPMAPPYSLQTLMEVNHRQIYGSTVKRE